MSATFTWSSNAGEIVAIASAGPRAAQATAGKNLGSALITAEANGVKATVFAFAAEPALGAVLLRDDPIIGQPTAVAPAAVFAPGFRYKILLAPA